MLKNIKLNLDKALDFNLIIVLIIVLLSPISVRAYSQIIGTTIPISPEISEYDFDFDYEFSLKTLKNLHFLRGQNFYGHSKGITSLDWSSNGELIASTSNDNILRIWNSSDGKQVNYFEINKTDIVTVVEWHPLKNKLAFGGTSTNVTIWDLDTGKISILEKHMNAITALSWNQKGDLLLSGSKDGNILLWNVTGGFLKTSYVYHFMAITDLDWNIDGNKFASSSNDKSVKIFSVSSRRIIYGLTPGHTDRVTSIDWHPDGKHLISTSEDKAINIYDASSGDLKMSLKKAHRNKINAISWYLNGSAFISGSDDHSIKVWWASNGTEIYTLNGDRPITKMKLNPKQTIIATGTSFLNIKLWNIDLDGDGMPDWWEQHYNLKYSLNDSFLDADLDRVNNLNEFNLGLNPTNEDTDGDGDNDGLELFFGFDPNDPSSSIKLLIIDILLLVHVTIIFSHNLVKYLDKSKFPNKPKINKKIF